MRKKQNLVLWTGLAIIFIATSGKCKNDFANRTPLSYEQVLEKGIGGCMEYYKVPGCAWAVLDDHEVTFGTAGVIFTGSEIGIDITHRFQIGSLGKSFTALMAAKCVEEGLIHWDTKLFSVFPEWKHKAHSAYADISLSDLLSHNTGLRPLNTHRTHIDKKSGKLVYENMPNFSGPDVQRRSEFSQYALSLKPVKSQGVNYGNAGFVIVGCMIEKISGKTWEQLAMELASDLDMEIDFERPNRLDPSQPWGHLLTRKNCLEPISPDEPRVYNDPLSSPAGNINVNIMDFAKYVRQYMNGLKNLDGMVSAGSYKYLLAGKEPYAMGWYNNFESDSIYYHYGSEGTFYCHMMIFANLNAAVIIFTNASMGNNSINFINDARNYLKHTYIYKADLQ